MIKEELDFNVDLEAEKWSLDTTDVTLFVALIVNPSTNLFTAFWKVLLHLYTNFDHNVAPIGLKSFIVVLFRCVVLILYWGFYHCKVCYETRCEAS